MSEHNSAHPGEESHAEILAAEAALARGDLVAARHHLHLAAQHGAQDKHIHKLTASIHAAAQVQEQRVHSGGGRAFVAAIVGYLCVSLQQPLGWTLPLWIFLAFLLVPCLVGLLVGLRQREGRAPGRSFWTAAKSAGIPMGLYTALHLILIGGPHSDGANAGEELIAGLLSVLVFALIAGLAAGAVSATIVGLRAREVRV